ncbi:hypothetical protein FE633_13465 [Streptomyces montanus]|uniref:Uncharacterized protein n=1 Tax=Streptomyces montanus TaxID=2580423 RepID=A0A5R9G2I1_9ACTN|nr:hypothetical protein [Streptomyces montanus]TLS45765.1 hypothetical protein FE633_13465 [Streptomyces montanus]
MTTTPRTPRLLLISAVVLAVAGVVLLSLPHDQEVPVSATPPSATASTHPSPAASSPSDHKPTDSTPPGQAALESVLPPHGEGAAGDQAIQKALEAAWPADLPAGDERQLLTAGRALLRADATGIGRANWPALFPSRKQAVAPAFATSRFRIQAAIARRDRSSAKAVVHLVWAGADRGGTYTDGRITDLHFTRTTSNKDGGAAWTPQPHI